MIDMYLLTGFLGVGKTTLLKNLIREFENSKIAIIVNEFGKEDVDGKLLSKDGMAIEEIKDGSIFCVCKLDRFVDALLKLKDLDIEYILVEGSGLADPLGMPKILSILGKQAPEKFQYRGSICVVDAINFKKVYKIAPAIKQQVQGADLIFLNKLDLALREEVDKVKNIIFSLNSHAEVIETSYSEVKDFEKIQRLQWYPINMENILIKKTLGINKFILRFHEVDIRKMNAWIEDWAQDVYRIKGFVKCRDKVYLVEAVGKNIVVEEKDMNLEQSYLVVIGPNTYQIKKDIQLSWEKTFGVGLVLE